jgi:hypothetical protein
MLCSAGHFDCVRYGIEHGCPLSDAILTAAVNGGHIACVELLVARGLPEAPYLLLDDGSTMGPIQPDHLQCMQYLLDNGRVIHPGTLICAARRGDVDAVRFLHGRGVPLWTAACEEDAEEEEFATHISRMCREIVRKLRLRTATIAIPEFAAKGLFASAHAEAAYDEAEPVPRFRMKTKQRSLRRQGVIAVPEKPLDTVPMWRALQYGWAMGAPLTPAMEEVFKAKRAATRATLLCFHVAARLSQGTGSLTQETDSATQGSGSVTQGTGPLTEETGFLAQGTDSLGEEEGASGEQRAAWAGMGHVPIELLEKILLKADFEIPESLGRSARRGGLMHVQRSNPSLMVWVRSDGT